MPDLGTAIFVIMLVFIDESGDLGWTLDKPYQKGGSSRYLTISILIIPESHKKYPKRLIRDLHTKYKIPTDVEIKGTRLTIDQREFFTQQVLKMLDKYPEIRIVSITVMKTNVERHIREDGNKLYNYMISLALLEEINIEEKVILFPDPRNVAVKSGNSLLDYLQTKLWFEMHSRTILSSISISSESSLNTKFVDIVTNIMWRKYETGDAHCADLLSRKVKCKRLFFK